MRFSLPAHPLRPPEYPRDSSFRAFGGILLEVGQVGPRLFLGRKCPKTPESPVTHHFELAGVFCSRRGVGPCCFFLPRTPLQPPKVPVYASGAGSGARWPFLLELVGRPDPLARLFTFWRVISFQTIRPNICHDFNAAGSPPKTPGAALIALEQGICSGIIYPETDPPPFWQNRIPDEKVGWAK